jgi:hypothetical protein
VEKWAGFSFFREKREEVRNSEEATNVVGVGAGYGVDDVLWRDGVRPDYGRSGQG